ncbi:MAG: PEGA domain-containing protein [Terriglobia bacterium]
MSQSSRAILHFTLVFFFACVPAFSQRMANGAGPHTSSGPAPVYGGAYGGYGGYDGFSDFGFYPSSSSLPAVPPSNWWASQPDSESPCQAGCNPNAGYEWDSVGTLILDTNPPQARVTLDGIYAGTTDKLGPFQLPVGEHTLHIEAPGFEPSDVIVKFDQPGVQSLNVALKQLPPPPKPARRSKPY